MKNCYDLNLNFLPIDITILDSLLPEKILTIGEEELTFECLRWIKETNLSFRDAHIFARSPFSGLNAIHIDGRPGYRRSFGVNWNFNTENFEMRWYKPLEKESPLSFNRGVAFTGYKENEVELIETSRSVFPVLFNTTIPHTVVNFTDKPRYSVSLTFKDNVSWDKIVEILDPWIVK